MSLDTVGIFLNFLFMPVNKFYRTFGNITNYIFRKFCFTFTAFNHLKTLYSQEIFRYKKYHLFTESKLI